MSMRWYVLDEQGEAAAVTDVHTFFAWERVHGLERQIAYDFVEGTNVSTVLLAGATLPTTLPFETLLLGGRYDDRRWRWATRKEAEDGHRNIVAALVLGLDPTKEL